MTQVLCAQVKNEKRIYLFDTTKSMQTLGIWDKVKDNLKSAIDQIDDPTTTIVIIPFIERIIDKWEEKATPLGKSILKSKIDATIAGGSTTNICTVIDEFYKNVDVNCINYMFLMTDGKHNTTNFENLITDLKMWNEKTKDKDVYGFYVMLHEQAHNVQVESVVDTQSNLWVVKTAADINVNIFRLKNRMVYNVRNQKESSVIIEGKLNKADNTELDFILESNTYYELKLIESRIKTGKVKFKIEPKVPISQIPDSLNLKIKVNFRNTPSDFTFVVPEVIHLNVINKKEKSLTIKLK